MFNVEKFIAGLHGYLERELDPFAKRLKALEERAPIPGPKGEKGDAGAEGKQGLQGPLGPKGEKGDAGVEGKQGLQGPQGPDGKKGDPGAEGKQGLQGLLGPKGEKGDGGPEGKQGLQGLQGGKGEKGDGGLEGKQGLQGLPGGKGEKGEKGEPGLSGKDGSLGPQGQPGIRGEKGDPGPEGKQGLQGIKGEDGKSITVEQARGIFEAEVRRWELEFERRGQDIMQRVIDRIPPTVNGKDGIPGREGKDGSNGKDGNDGLGFDDLQVLQKDEKTVLLRFSRGEKIKEFTLSFPVIIDRGVYKTDSVYAKGDGVTYAGSFWFCQKEKTSSKPGEDANWRLAVKRGRDARVEP